MASKEFSIESALDKMAAEWEGAILQLLEYRALDALGAVPIQKIRFGAGGEVHERTLPFAARSLSRRVLDEALLQQLDDHIGESLLQALVSAPCCHLPAARQSLDNPAARVYAAMINEFIWTYV